MACGILAVPEKVQDDKYIQTVRHFGPRGVFRFQQTGLSELRSNVLLIVRPDL